MEIPSVFPPLSFFLIQDPVQDPTLHFVVSVSLSICLSPPWASMTLPPLKSNGQLFCRVFKWCFLIIGFTTCRKIPHCICKLGCICSKGNNISYKNVSNLKDHVLNCAELAIFLNSNLRISHSQIKRWVSKSNKKFLRIYNKNVLLGALRNTKKYKT